MIQPDMTPTEINLAVVQVTKQGGVPAQLVQMTVSQPTGVTYVFFEGDAAAEVGFNLMESGKQAKSGLQVVPSLEGLPPLPKDMNGKH